MRKEHDFLGEMEIADDLYYGVQTSILRANTLTVILLNPWRWLKKQVLWPI